MVPGLSFFSFKKMRPPVRRVLALDPGSRRLKLLLAETDFGRLRLLQEELIDLQAEGLLSPEEIRQHLFARLEDWGRPAVALVLPQHLSMSQVLDLPLAPESEVERLIAGETIKLSGAAETKIVYDFVRTDSTTPNRQRFWVTVCQESHIRERIVGLGLEQEDISEVTTTANALIAAFRAAAPDISRAILVHLGAQTTAVVILLAGQGAFAATFQMGGEFFTRALARLRACSEDAARSLKREKNLLTGPDAFEPFAEVVDGWAAELKRQLNDWFKDNPKLAPEAGSFTLVASGGGFLQPGLLEYLQTQAGLDLKPWPAPIEGESLMASPGFEVALGAALQALGYSPQPVSLLPEDYRQAWQKRLVRQRVETASFVLLSLCVLLLALGTWKTLSLVNSKEALLKKVQAGQDAVEANDALTAELVSEYENLRPILASQQNTIDTLKTLSLVEQSCGKSNLWFVLLSDQQSYFSRPLAVLSTNRPAKTNLLGMVIEPRALPLNPQLSGALSNVALAKPGLIAEICVPGDAEGSRQSLSDLVNNLKQQSLFSKVDLLSDDLRRALADPKVTVPERDYVLALDFAETDLQQPAHWKRLAPGPRGPRRSSRPGTPAETPDSGLPPIQ